MVTAIVFAQVWGVVQLIILATPSRTVRIRTVFAAMAVGFYLLGPVTAFLQLSWIHLAAAIFGVSADTLQRAASHTVDPFLEEAVKLVPLALLMGLRSIRRQWSITDCLLVAAATGSGFGLAEAMFRYAAYPHAAHAVAGGWAIPIGMVGSTFIPGFFHTLTSWLPSGAYVVPSATSINYHLAWSAIGGLAFGLVLRRRTRKALGIGIALFVLIGLDHAASNSEYVADSWLGPFLGPLNLVTVGLGVLTLASTALAWWLDQPAQRAGMALGPRMAVEESASSPALGTLTASLSRFPWSLPWVYGFDRERRAFQAAHATAGEGREAMLAALVTKRDALEARLKETVRPPLRPAWLNPATLKREVRLALRKPPVILWLVLISPSVLFLIVGGFPQTAWLQRLLTAPVMWQLTLLITIIGQARIALRVYKGLKQLPATMRLPIGDDAAVLSLQLACGIGAVTLGAFTLERVLGGVGSRDHLFSAHAADAVQRATPGSAVATAGSASAATGPGPAGSPSGGSGSGSASSSTGQGSSASGSGNSGNNGSPNPYLNEIPTVKPAPKAGDSYTPPSDRPPPAPNPNPLPPPPPPDSVDKPPSFDDIPLAVRPAPNPNPLPPPPPPPIDDLPPPQPPEYGPPRPPFEDDDSISDPAPGPTTPQSPVPPAPNPNPLPPPPPPDDLPVAPSTPSPAPDPGPAPQSEEPSVPVNDLPDAPQPKSTPVEDLPDAPQPKSVPVNDLPDAPPTKSVPVEDLPDAPQPKSVPVNDLPDAPQPKSVPVEDLPDAPQPKSVPVEDLPDAPQPKSVPVNDLPDAPPSNPTPPAPKALSPQDLADQAADRAAQAQADADAAHRAAINADSADESAWIRSQTTDPSSDGKAAADAAHDAANQAESAAKAASDRAAAAQAAANDAQANADAAAAKADADAARAAANAARAADPAQARADDAAKAYAAAQAHSNEAFYHTSEEQYHDALAAEAAAKARAEAAQAAADAAHNSSGSAGNPHKKP